MADHSRSSESLEQRLRAVEDRLEIFQLMMSHPPSIDGGALEYWATVFTEDAMMDRGPPDPEKHSGDRQGAYGKKQILEEVASPELQALREAGLAHITTIPYLTISGDEAIATNYTQLLGYEQGSFRVRRVIANRWELARQSGAWKVRRRTFRLLDGKPEAREILRRGVEQA